MKRYLVILFAILELAASGQPTSMVTFAAENGRDSALQGNLQQTVTSGSLCAKVVCHTPIGYKFYYWTEDGKFYSHNEAIQPHGHGRNLKYIAVFKTTDAVIRYLQSEPGPRFEAHPSEIFLEGEGEITVYVGDFHTTRSLLILKPGENIQ